MGATPNLNQYGRYLRTRPNREMATFNENSLQGTGCQ